MPGCGDLLDTGNTFNNQVLRGNGSSLVEATYVNVSCEGDTERFCAVDGYECSSATVLHLTTAPIPNLDKATRDALTARESSIGNSGGTTLVTMRMQSSSSFDFFNPRSRPDSSKISKRRRFDALEQLTLHPNIPARCDGENEKEADEKERLKVVGRDTILREDHGANKLTLGSTEASAQDSSETASIRSRFWILR